MIIALDAGHGYKRSALSYTGAKGNAIIEDDWAIHWLERVAHYLRARGHTTIYTRKTAELVDLKTRARIAKQSKADLFLSIHLNAAADPKANGVEALVAKPDTRSRPLAAAICALFHQHGFRNRGVKTDDQGQHKSIYVLRNTYARMPAVLIECGFLTNIDDAIRLKDRQLMERLACELAKLIDSGA